MKKTAILGLSLLLITAGLNAQKMNNIKTDLFSAFLRTGVIKYERAITEDISAQLGFFYTGFTPRDSDSKLNGIGITPEFRFYLSDTPAPNGTYLAPNIRYMSLTVEDPVANESGTLTSLSFAINLGKQVLLKDIILIDAWVGPAYAFRSVDATGEVDPGIPDINGFGIRIGLAIGVAF
ncbi:MAG: DUF3575 domain-containing protein [Bacteroidota bacterium]